MNTNTKKKREKGHIPGALNDGFPLACVAGGILWFRDLSFGGGAVFRKKGVGTSDGSAVKSHSNILQRLRRQISLDYYTIPPATQASFPQNSLKTLFRLSRVFQDL